MSFKGYTSKDKTIKSDNLVQNLFSGQKLAGTKWSKINTGRTGFATLMDAPIIEDHLKTEKRNMGKGFLKLQVPDFNKADATPVQIGGRLMYPNDKGVFTIIDEAVVNKMASIEEEKRTYVESLIEKASMSDEICQLILGLETAQELVNLLGPGADAGDATEDPDVIAVNALPSAIETYDPSGITYSRAIQKFKLCIKTHMPMLDNLTPAKTINQEA